MNRSTADCQGYSRRDFLHVGSASVLGLGLSQLLQMQATGAGQATSGNAKNVVMIWLSGGPATIDMWDMKPNAPSGIRGEFAPIDTSLHGVQISEHLPQLAKVMHHCCLIRSCHHTLAAHGPGTELLLTGNWPTPALTYPALGSIASRSLPPAAGVPGFMSMGEGAEAGAGYLGAAYNPFKAEATNARFGPAETAVGLPDGFSADDLQRRSRLLWQFDRQLANLDAAPLASRLSKFQQQAIDMLRSDKTRTALDVGREDVSAREQYGNGQLGIRLLAARRLVEAGVRFVTVGMTGWDTHGNNFGMLRTQLLPELDQALAALIDDLHSRGLLGSTVVYCTGEFGRTPNINSGGGRDHWARAMSVLLAGGPLCRGMVYGSTEKHGHEPLDNPCSPMDVSATVLDAIGISPETTLTTPSGRPLAAIANGRSILAVLARA